MTNQHHTPEGALSLDKKSPRYTGGILIMLKARLLKFWHDLPEALRTGRPPDEKVVRRNRLQTL